MAGARKTLYDYIAEKGLGSIKGEAVVNYKKSAVKFALRGLFYTVIAVLAFYFKIESSISYILFGVGMLFLGFGIYYFIKSEKNNQSINLAPISP